jgi:hypothetical protein
MWSQKGENEHKSGSFLNASKNNEIKQLYGLVGNWRRLIMWEMHKGAQTFSDTQIHFNKKNLVSVVSTKFLWLLTQDED